MDWFPLYNSLRIALVSSIFVFFTGIFVAYYIAKLPPGCGADSSAGSSTYGCRIFFADDPGAA